MQAPPLTAQEFDAAVRDLFGQDLPKTVALAVSGGPDSMALALCAKEWALRHGCRIVALLVDHRLRPESEEEANAVLRRLESLDIPPRILTWNHGPVTSKIHVQARDARYALLRQACAEEGAETLFLAHQAEDQAETILLRLAKGSGIAGLAGIPPVSIQNGLRLARPLLSFSKERLIATCETAGVVFVTDPSNKKHCYARGRLRHVQEALATEGLTTERLVDLADRARDAHQALTQITDTFLRDHAETNRFGVLKMDRAAFEALPRDIALRALTQSLRSLAPNQYAPRRDALLRLFNSLREPSAARHALGGVLVSVNNKKITFLREAAAQTGKTPLSIGETILWDKNWKVTLSLSETTATPLLKATFTPNAQTERKNLPEQMDTSFHVAPLGLQTHALTEALCPGLVKACPEGRARAALPALWQDGNLVGIAFI